MCAWTKDRFRREVYNDSYVDVDPDYVLRRPLRNAEVVHNALGEHKARITHLDYGGGSGLLSRSLRRRGWNSATYDPMTDGESPATRLDLITAFEVFQHNSSPLELIVELDSLIVNNGVIVIRTLFSDGEIDHDLNWWYAAPRNGHINLYSRRSLSQLATMAGMAVCSLTNGTH